MVSRGSLQDGSKERAMVARSNSYENLSVYIGSGIKSA